MDMTGERRIAAPRNVVWQALNDPEVLKVSIPGCESLEKSSDTDMRATVAVKIGPISARFTGTVHLTDIEPPTSYTISGEGQGGVAGFAKGGANVRLDDADGGTLLRYEVNAQVGGKIAQLGARLIDASAKQMADAFFDRFSAHVAPPAAAVGVEPIAGEPVAASAMPLDVRPVHQPPPATISPFALVPREPFGLPIVAWIGGVIYLFILILILGSLI
jgi:uncharacterized protein